MFFLDMLTLLRRLVHAKKWTTGFLNYRKYFPLELKTFSTASILDVGTGNGNFIKYLRHILGNKNAYGLERQGWKLRGYSKKRDGLVVGDGMAIPFPDGHFEIVISRHYLPMFVCTESKRVQSLSEMLRVTRPGGLLLSNIQTPQQALVFIEECKNDPVLHKSARWAEERHRGAVEFLDHLESLEAAGYGVSFYIASKSVVLQIRTPQP